jgi:putative transposase
MIGILKTTESGVSVTMLCCKHGASDATLYNWRAQYNGIDVSLMKRMREPE